MNVELIQDADFDIEVVGYFGENKQARVFFNGNHHTAQGIHEMLGRAIVALSNLGLENSDPDFYKVRVLSQDERHIRVFCEHNGAYLKVQATDDSNFYIESAWVYRVPAFYQMCAIAQNWLMEVGDG